MKMMKDEEFDRDGEGFYGMFSTVFVSGINGQCRGEE